MKNPDDFQVILITVKSAYTNRSLNMKSRKKLNIQKM